ncbi:hypothetical protein ABWQ07_000710 [Campylobacter jejuni]
MTKQEIQKLDTNFLDHRKPLFSLSMVELWERFAFMAFLQELVFSSTLPGGWITDNYLGQKKALFLGSFIIALGHISIALSILSTSIFSRAYFYRYWYWIF